ncbi:uncharacterized protein LOC131031354 [Cryptomeria japonica]|uniref:uncharacterized protein LOC131031354 n=1 Tax=Cryptomeria japonica TaxID=3369 RepID=UPI0025AD805D|nr:uncharacterized protein LOC131031354 [Cryptomeria japonica]
MESKGPPEKLHCSPKHARSEFDGGIASKRQRTGDNGDGFQEFSALIDRIQEMHRDFRQRRMDFQKISTVENVGVHDIKRKSLWKPSFEWEDFSCFVSKANASAQGNLSCCKIKKARNSVVVDEYMPVGSLDLNAEPTSE